MLVLTFTLIYAKNVYASVTNVRYYDENYVLISGISGNCNTSSLDYPRNNVRYIRFNLDDQFQPNKSYSATFNFSIAALSDYAWLQWTGASGFNLGGAYIGSSPDSARTSAQSVVIGPPNLYQKSSSTLFTFTTGTSVSNSFFQLDLISPRSLVSTCMDSYSINIDNSSQDSQNIINNNNMNTGSIIANNNNNTNQIINNQNNNTQNIINNQNSNTDKEIESQKVCKTRTIDKDNIVLDNRFLNSSGVVSNNNDFGVTDFISINNDSKIEPTFLGVANTYDCFYSSDKTLISCVGNLSLSLNQYVTIPNNAKFVRFSIHKNTNRPIFSVNSCIGGNQALSDDINDLNNTLNDTSIDGSSIGSQFAEIDMISDTPITDLLTMPLVLLNKLYDTIDTSCSAYILPFGLLGGNESITLPCFDGQRFFGSVWGVIDSLFCFFMLYNIGMMIVKFFEGITSLHDVFDDMYVPQHSKKGVN